MGHCHEHRDNYLCHVGACQHPPSRLDFSGRSFAIGLGPVPFVIIPEVSPFHVSTHGPQRQSLIGYSISIGRFCDIVGCVVAELSVTHPVRFVARLRSI